MKVLILEPYFTGSHKNWAEGYRKFSKHEVDILSLPGNFWKWRMHGGAVTLAQKYLAGDFAPDLLLATDMLDLTTFLALTKDRTAGIPTAVYFHENQLSYPWSPEDRDVLQKRDKHYGFINYVTALAADAVFFNSGYHRQSFLDELRRFLKHFPDYQDLGNIDKIASKSDVLPLGIDLSRFDEFRPQARKAEEETRKSETGGRFSNSDAQIPLILWNHRWEFDKNPNDFFQALFILAERGIDFQVAILGECFSRQPKEFILAREVLGDRIVHFGYAESFADYAAWLWRTDILPVTSKQDFFGASVVEAIYCGCLPLLPNRLAYPELLPVQQFAGCFYQEFDGLVELLAAAIQESGTAPAGFSEDARKYDWSAMATQYDETLATII